MKLLKIVTIVLISIASVKADARMRDQWVEGFGQGILEYSNYLDNEDQTKIVFSDASNAEVDGRVEIFLTIDGISPLPNVTVRFLIDGSIIEMNDDGKGSLATDCHTCAVNFDGLWRLIRSGTGLIVEFENKRASFSLKGSARVLPSAPPLANFYR